MTPETVQSYVDDIKARVASWRNGELVDPPLQSELLTKALTELAYMAGETCRCYPFGVSPDSYEGPQRDCPVHGEPSFWAGSLLEDLRHRAVSGIPFGEPDERPYEYTLDAEERGGH